MVVGESERTPLRIAGGGRFFVRRVFCIGKNYAAHVAELGGDPRSDPPVFFSKPADAVFQGADAPYPPETNALHHEGELVVAIDKGGRSIAAGDADDHIFGYAVGCDFTRRDLQNKAKSAGGPWDAAKGFDWSAPIGDIVPKGEVTAIASALLTCSVNGEIRQQAPLSEMIWSIPMIIEELSKYFILKSGDLIFTGTPEGVGEVTVGDEVTVHVEGVPMMSVSITPPDFGA
ncbi:MAG: fumarylacetoacetate hydrolase family protein [Pseudomonadota bacterium]